MTIPKTQNVLVTGATGFVGRQLVKTLQTNGYSIRGVSRHQDNESNEVKPVNWDDQASIQNVVEGMNCVVHLAGVAHSNAAAVDYQKYNIDITKRLIDASIRAGVKRLIFISSTLASTADEKEKSLNYAGSKKTAEHVIQTAAKNSSIEITILRPVNIYGTQMKGNIAAMITLIQSKKLPRLPELNNQISLIGVGDVCNAILICLQSAATIGKTYTLTDGEKYKISDIETAIYEEMASKMPVLKVPRVVLFLAANLAGFLAATGIRRGGISGKTYRNLVQDNLHSNAEFVKDTGFESTTTFFKELPSIIASLSKTTK